MADQNVGVSANPSPTPPTSQPSTNQDLAKTETDIETRMSGFERATLRWTRAMFFVTTATALFIAFQWKEMHDAGTQTDRIIAADERIATAMESSVRKSEEILTASIETSRNDQRAWVGINGIQVVSLEAGKKIAIQ